MSILFRGSFGEDTEKARRKMRCDIIVESYHNDPMRLAERIYDLEHELEVNKTYSKKLEGQIRSFLYQD